MALVLSEEQEILQRTAREFVAGRSSLKRNRELRDRRDADGFSRSLWREMAALGWLGIVMPEEHGGAGLGYTDLMVVMEEFGRALMPEPILSNAVLGAAAFVLGGTEAQQREHLPALAAGERFLALAALEAGSRHDYAHVETRARRAGRGWHLAGEKRHVLDGQVADTFVVSARTGGAKREPDGITLFLVPRDTPGVRVERQWRIDGRGAALVTLDDAAIDTDAMLGGVGQGADLLARIVDRGTIALTAEMVGGMSATFDMTLAYLKTRVQFGEPIGSFQALKHRAARLFVETELVRSAVVAAHRALDDSAADDRRIVRAAAIAKARASDAYMLIAHEAVQMHGGIGMTDEHDIGLYLKHARGAELTFGDAAWHRARLARIDGY